MHLNDKELLPAVLPGFEDLMLTPAELDERDVGADISRKVFTAEKLKAKYPGKYRLAARAFFEKGRSAEAICDVLQISTNTLHALIEAESKARGFLSVKAAIRAKATSLTFKAMQTLQTMLDDEELVKKAGIVGMTNAIKALSGTLGESESEKKADEISREVIDNDYIDVIEETESNGFSQDIYPVSTIKKTACDDANAPADRTDDEREDAANLSTVDDNFIAKSSM